MGWFSINRGSAKDDSLQSVIDSAPNDVKAQAVHIEHAEPARNPLDSEGARHRRQSLEFPFLDVSIPDEKLPFISSSQVQEQRPSKSGISKDRRLWIVVDNVVYDCTHFVSEHPGGDTVINSFVGEDCSWQFWRFHSNSIMRDFGRPLRVGRTEGVNNRFKEPPRYFGLARMGRDEW
jgi:cytochrome b involved in lipid metabolism